MIVEKEKMDAILEEMPPEPSGVRNWIRRECVAMVYIIADNKEHIAVCSRCGKSWSTGDEYVGRHNGRGKCPFCRREATIKAAGLGRGGLTEYFRILTFAKKGRTVYARLWEIDAGFEGFGPVSLRRWLSAVYVINKEEQSYYKHRPGGCWYPERWEKIKQWNLPRPPSGFGYLPSKYDWTLTYRRNLKGIFSGTDLEYTYIDGIEKLEARSLLCYVGLALRHHSVELLAKAGFKNVIGDRIDGMPRGALNWRGESLQKILRLPRRHVRYLQKKNPTLYQIRIFQQLSEEEKRELPWEYVEYLSGRYYQPREALDREITDHAPLKKTLLYLTNQPGDLDRNLSLWKDYVRTGKKMAMDFRRNRILYPENLKAAHDEVVNIWSMDKDKNLNRAIAVQARKEEYEAGALQIIPATSMEALYKESRELHHCVKTYGERIAEGRCWIWFIREVSDPDTPYYTMETDTSGNMLQCRGDHNCGMTEEVQAFAQRFSEHLKRKIMKERRSA